MIELIQVAYDLVSPKTFKRETEALMQAAAKQHCQELTLVAVTESRDEIVNDHTIHIRNVVDWLLMKSM
ncbi:MAG: hypothetical protein IJK78_04255 [Bacteroidales bacterium]|nr:hypothetical protein [Bacteroidales bacterium]